MKRAAIVAFAITAATPRVARATPDFPQTVVQALGLQSVTVDPPQGCKLCHTTDAGGTSLRPFGSLMQQYGVQPYQPSTVQGALAGLEHEQPQLIEDIKAGRDPNDDTGSSNVHAPQYGCGAAPGARATSRFAWVATLAIVLVRTIRSRRRRSVRSPA